MISIVFGCTNPLTKEQNDNKRSLIIKGQLTDLIKYKVEKLDSLFKKHDNRYLKVFVKTSDQGKYFQVVDFTKIPDNISETLNLFYDSSGKLLVFKDIPNSESGDNSNVYTYYFDDIGKTIAFKTVSSFFGSDCAIENSTITEETLKYFDPAFKQIKEDY